MPYLWVSKLCGVFDKLRQNKHIQLILGLLPCLFCFIYTSAFLVDTLNTYGVLSINNDIITESSHKKAILSVSDYDKDTYLIQSNKTIQLSNPEKICTIKYELGYDCVYYAFVLENMNYLVNYNCNFIEYDKESDTFVIDNNIKVKPNNTDRILCDIIFDNDSFYIKTNTQKEKLNNTLNFELIDNKVILNDKFLLDKKTYNDSNKFFTTMLDDNELHYDGLNHMYIQNVGDNFLRNFLLGTNCILFLCLLSMYVVALIYWGKHYKLSYFVCKPVVVSNIVSLIALIISLIIAIILFI